MKPLLKAAPKFLLRDSVEGTAGYVKLQRWLKRMEARPGLVKCTPTGDQAIPGKFNNLEMKNGKQ